jgi:hypothetical protein
MVVKGKWNAALKVQISLVKVEAGRLPRVPLQTKHTQCGETFHAYTWFHGTIWRDWVFIDWGDLENQMFG